MLSNPFQNAWKIVLAVLGVAVVVILIAVPTALFLNEKKEESMRTFTLNDYFNSTIRARSFNLRWVSDNEYLHKLPNGSVILVDLSAANEKEFLKRQSFDQVEAFDYMVSADRKFVCFLSNYTKIWRHSYTASYSIFDVERGVFITTDLPHDIQYLAWSPSGHKLAYVWMYNVYVKASPTLPSQQVTFNGLHNMILNGIPDWVYEEIIPRKVFLGLNGHERKERKCLCIHVSLSLSEQQIFLSFFQPGTPNPTVRLFVVDSTNVSKIMEVVVPSAVGAVEHYLSTVTWATDERIAVQWQNRTQSYVTLQLYELSGDTWEETTGINMVSATGWVGRFSPSDPVYRPDGSSCYYITSDASGFKHIHHISGNTSTPITSGNWEVISILKNYLTYIKIFFYRISIDGSTHSQPTCLTCTLAEDRCQYNSASFSTDGTYYRMDCSGPGLPLYTLRNSQGAEIRVLEDNKNLDSILKDIGMPTVTHGTMKIGEFELWYQMTLPPNFDKSKKYPLLIDVYAGPCSQKSDLRFRIGWTTYLASTEKVIVASFDGRGSGYQGDKIMHSIYKRLGTYDVEDQITAAKYFISLGYVDKERIAIWGWSYGGYVTSMVLGAGSGVFKCGMAVAPVSKWEYYDTIYTERYMLTPSQNQAFYDNSTVTGRAKNFKSVQYLLVHGTADGEASFLNTCVLTLSWYTDEDHSLGGSANQHVYTHMSHFLKKCFA
uniref:Dipeptidyl-peptidase 4 n=1 Tax=Astyanax mexicanus TaxID=7994 RepID=W5L275_ASTMX